MKAYKSF